GRRLTLAPATRRALLPRGQKPGGMEDDGEADVDDDRRCKEGREALSRLVDLVVAASGRPKPIHGVEPVNSKFWSCGDSDSESSVDEEIVAEEANISTPEFILKAAAAGFTVQDLQQAEQELSSPEVLFRGTHWLWFWALLQRTEDQRDQLVEACQVLESRAMQFFASHGWPFFLRIGQ
ncbi:unnamed protein product, partial [Urochloa humidicola]